MSRQVGCYTESSLRAIAKEPNAVVYEATHDIQYTPWPASRVERCVDDLVQFTRSGAAAAAAQLSDELREFASKYTVFFQKLTDAAFVADAENVRVVKKLVALRAMVESGEVDEATARATSADLAFKSLATRLPAD